MAEAVLKSSRRTEGKLIILEGNIAAGKSTLSKRLGEYFNYVVRFHGRTLNKTTN